MHASGGIAVEALHLRKKFGRTQALKNVSFTVREGELYSILGPNGAGKTTTMRALVGGVKLDGGVLKVLGMDARKEVVRVRSKCGVMSELPGLFPELTVEYNLRLMGELYGVRGQQLNARLRELVEFLGLKPYLSRRYGHLSKGLKRRVDLAASLIHDPQLLLLDEPLSGLDVRSKSLLKGKLRELASEGRTVIMTSHIIPDAMELSDRVLVIAGGISVAEGRPEELKDRVMEGGFVEVRFSNLNEELIKSLNDAFAKVTFIKGGFARVKVDSMRDSLKKLALIAEAAGVDITYISATPTSWDEVLMKLAGVRIE